MRGQVPRSLAGPFDVAQGWLLGLGATAGLVLASITMHRRELRADSSTVVFDLLAFDPKGTLGSLAQTGDRSARFAASIAMHG